MLSTLTSETMQYETVQLKYLNLNTNIHIKDK
jgi:hypothetical protein